MSSKRASFGFPLGCGSVVGLCALALLTGTVMSNLPSLSAPVRLELTVSAAGTGVSPQAGGPTTGPITLPTPTSGPAVPSSIPPLPATNGVSSPWSAAIPAAACIPADIPQTGHVLQVIDGQTIRVLMDRNQRVYAVRYLGIQIPSGGPQSVIANAQVHNRDLTLGKSAVLVRDLTDQDNYGRLLRYVMVGQVFVNYDLVAGGYALANSAPPDTSCYSTFESAEMVARSGGLGLWSLPTP